MCLLKLSENETHVKTEFGVKLIISWKVKLVIADITWCICTCKGPAHILWENGSCDKDFQMSITKNCLFYDWWILFIKVTRTTTIILYHKFKQFDRKHFLTRIVYSPFILYSNLMYSASLTNLHINYTN